MSELRVHSIETFGTHEGPGIRFVLFLQGCLFKCLYCHNPDTIPMQGGSLMFPEDIVKKVVEMKPYFANNGGFTVSGGEPLLQAKSLISLLQLLRQEGIHIAVDTNGFVWNDDVKEVVDLTDLFLLDIKHMDPTLHRALTGQDNTSVFAFADYLESQKKPFWIRYVYVPGYSDQEEFLHALGKRFGGFSALERIEILPYHRLGEHKRKELGWKYELDGVQPPTVQKVDEVKAIFEQYFKKVVIR